MRIVLSTTTFPPVMGGYEFVTEVVAQKLGEAGHDVTVLTLQPGDDIPGRSYRLVRQPAFGVARRICRDAQIVVMANVALKNLPPILATRTPLAIWQHGSIGIAGARTTRLKQIVLGTRSAVNIGVSGFVTALFPKSRPSATAPDPYDPEAMFEEPGVARDGDLVMLGRLVSEKAFDLVLRAMALAPLAGARVSIVGTGPEQPVLEALAAELGIADRVAFLGRQTGAELRRTLNAHRTMVMPSVNEGFGVVVLEALACGCAVVASDAGGLPEAVGACGTIFSSRDPGDVARVIAEARAAPRDPDPERRRAHLARHRPEATAARLVELLTPYAAKR